jgi:hypothetical protein
MKYSTPTFIIVLYRLVVPGAWGSVRQEGDDGDTDNDNHQG